MAGSSKAKRSDDGWPEDGGPLSFEDIALPVIHAVRCAYTLERKDRRCNIPWHGPEIGQGERACSPRARDRLKAGNLQYAEEDQGRDALEEIITLAVQLGIEQGRRIAKSTEDEVALLNDAYGAEFEVKVGYQHTSVHTRSGFHASPRECLEKAIEALKDEISRVERCPRQRAICPDLSAKP